MGIYRFRLPDIGEGVTEAELAAWHVKPGDSITEDQPLADVMTEKATVEIPSPVTGIVRALHGQVGDRIAIGSTFVELETETRDTAPAQQPAPQPAAQQPPPAHEPPTESPLAAPATRHRARELGLALETIPGTGPEGRITPADLEAHAAAQTSHPPAARTRKIIGLRRKIAEKLTLATQRIPHFTYVEEFDMTELESLRASLNEERLPGQPKLTLLPFFIRALTCLLPEFPAINAHYDDATGILHEYDERHIGIATQTKDGLMVPVIRHAENLDLFACAGELARITQAAREGKARPEELSGSTITLTSLGALGGIAATPILNAPEVAILAPNKLAERPVIRKQAIAIRTMMNLSASFDHRIIDGHDAARFIHALKRLMESPESLAS
jgi:2-oxoisovalerate dehydrogenase E2 component (dihydrolipoyl transacylase)